MKKSKGLDMFERHEMIQRQIQDLYIEGTIKTEEMLELNELQNAVFWYINKGSIKKKYETNKE